MPNRCFHAPLNGITFS